MSEKMTSPISLAAETEGDNESSPTLKPWERLNMSKAHWYRLGKPDTTPTSRGQRDTWLKNLSIEVKRPMYDLCALTVQNDPFNAEVPYRKRAAEWFAELYRQYGFGVGTHIRRIHYRLVSQTSPIIMPNGKPYENTENCSVTLGTASRDARYLGLVDINDFVDRHNGETIVNLTDVYGRDASLELDNSSWDDISLPSLPTLCFSAPKVPQRYHLEIICEKSTVDDILIPLGKKYEINVTCCVGEISLTRCLDIIKRAIASRRPVRILYLSDFDPGGDSMPVACARKIEFLLRKMKLVLDIQLRPVVLTHEQCVELKLPRTPIKEKEKRAGRFQERFGEGATELDALEALHPGKLENILTQEIERYYDIELDENVDGAASGLDDEIDAVNDSVHDQYADEIEALRNDCAALNERREMLFQQIEDSLGEGAPSTGGIEWPEPCDGDEDPDPLYDSKRSYIDQIDRYKAHQGKLTRRKP
jgi:hypothetical protein